VLYARRGIENIASMQMFVVNFWFNISAGAVHVLSTLILSTQSSQYLSKEVCDVLDEDDDNSVGSVLVLNCGALKGGIAMAWFGGFCTIVAIIGLWKEKMNGCTCCCGVTAVPSMAKTDQSSV